MLAGGRSCSQPALRLRRFCRFHDLTLKATRNCAFPHVDSAENLQVVITQIITALADGAMERRTGQLCFYGLNLAAANLHRLHRERNAALSPVK